MNDLVDLVEIASPIIALATLALGYAAHHLLYRKVKRAYSEAVDLLVAIRDAWEDDEVSTEEFNRIVTEAGEFIGAVKE